MYRSRLKQTSAGRFDTQKVIRNKRQEPINTKSVTQLANITFKPISTSTLFRPTPFLRFNFAHILIDQYCSLLEYMQLISHKWV